MLNNNIAFKTNPPHITPAPNSLHKIIIISGVHYSTKSHSEYMIYVNVFNYLDKLSSILRLCVYKNFIKIPVSVIYSWLYS